VADDEFIGGTLNHRTSWFNAVTEECFSLPTMGLRIKKPESMHVNADLPYDDRSRADQMVSSYLDWDLNALDAARVECFNLRSDKNLRKELLDVVRLAGLRDEDAFNNDYENGQFRREDFARITVRRSQDNQDRALDFSFFVDSPNIDWCPASMPEHAHFAAFRPQLPKFEILEAEAIRKLKSAQKLVVWVSVFGINRGHFENYAELINTLIHQGGNKRPCTDTWLSAHSSYAGRAKRDRTNEWRYWEQFRSDKTSKNQEQRPWPERQPWLQVAGTDEWLPVSAPNRPRTRFPGLVQYEQTMMLASLFELEETVKLYDGQYNSTNI
jgi:hypothetical protein